MPRGKGRTAKTSGRMRASPLTRVTPAGNPGISCRTVAHHHPDLEAFGRLEGIRVARWEEEVGELAKWTWKRMTTKNPNWGETSDYIEDWRRGVLIATTVGYHNLVIRWNPRTLPRPEDPLRTMEDATYRLTDDSSTDPSVVLLQSEGSSKS